MIASPRRDVLSARFRRVSFLFIPRQRAIDTTSSSRYGLDIAIVGAGTAGLALAALLARTHRVTVYERAPQPGAVGAGLLLQPSGMQVLQRMGLLAPLLELGERIDRLHGTLPDRASGRAGWPVMDMRYRDVHHKAFGLGLSRHALFQTLSGAARRAGAMVAPGTEIATIRQDDDGAHLLAADGSSRRADICVVANGSFSGLRESLGIRHHARPYPWGALWALLPDRPRGVDGTLRQWYRGTHQMLGLMPTGMHGANAEGAEARWVSLFWSVRADRVETLRAQPLDQWKREVAALTPVVAPYLELIDDWSQLAWARYADVRMRRPWNGRVVFIGDSAHAMSPQLGQGANMALVDAFVLAWSLGACGAGASRAEIETAFARHTRARRDHLAFYQRASRWLTPLFQSDTVAAAWLRNLCFWPASRAPLLRGHAVHTLAGHKTGLLFGRMRLPA